MINYEKVFKQLKELAIKRNIIIVTAMQPKMPDNFSYRPRLENVSDIVYIDYIDLINKEAK